MYVDSSQFVALQLQLLRRKKMVEPPRATFITTTAEWEYLRPIITQLHNDGMELKRIMEKIRQEHKYKASEKMFKDRFKAWGLRRNNRRHEVERILQIRSQREKCGKQTVFFIGDREVDMADIERYRRRHHVEAPNSELDEPAAKKFMGLEWYTPPPSPSPESSSAELTPYSSSEESSPRLTPRTLALPGALAHREGYVRGVAVGFEQMIKTGIWDVSNSLEMPWVPTLVHPTSEPTIPPYYYQDECFRYLTNGVAHAQVNDREKSYREWNAASALISTVVQSTHYNVLAKLLECILYLNRQGFPAVAEAFRIYVYKMAQIWLRPGHPYYAVFRALRYVPLEEIAELQMATQDILVKELESFLGPLAFTSFEHKMVFAQRRLEADPHRQIDELMPTDTECSATYGHTSSKTFLALNLRYCVLRSRGLLQEAEGLCMKIIERALLVEDPSVRLWHLASAWLSLGRVQFDLSEFRLMRFSLIQAWTAEKQLRDDHGLVKLGEAELNWIAARIGLEPLFRDMEPISVDIQDSSSS